MRRYYGVLGWVVGIITLYLLSSLIGGATCRDGWHSPSIGRPGACSHHGGVQSNYFLGFVFFYLSIAIGLLTSYGLNRLHKYIASWKKPTRTLRVCVQCKQTFPLIWHGESKEKDTVLFPEGYPYCDAPTTVRCPHCAYEEDL